MNFITQGHVVHQSHVLREDQLLPVLIASLVITQSYGMDAVCTRETMDDAAG